MGINDVLQLPVYLQVSLGGGFLAYAIAFHGRRKDDKTIDLLFGTIAFSLPGLLLWLWLQSINYAVAQSITLVLIVSVLLGTFWRKWGQRWLYSVMFHTRVSNDTGHKNTWQRLIQDTDVIPSQVTVHLKNGDYYTCDDVQSFNGARVPGWSIDDDGNVAIYVTRINEEPVEREHLLDSQWGDQITYVPVSEIKAVDFRFR